METEVIGQERQPAQKAARWEDFVDIFFSPGELFRRRANESWLIPLLFGCALAMIFYFAFPSVQRAFAEAQIAQMIEKRPEMAARMQGRNGYGTTQHVIGGIVTPIGITIFVLLSAFFTWLAAKITSVDLTWRKALMINAWVMIVGVLSQLAINVVALLKVNRGEALHPWTDRSLGVVRFMDAENTNGAVLAMLSRIDPFAIWALVLMAIALGAAANAPKSRAWATAAIVWILSALPFLIPAAMS
jgi:hypothetical protein